MAEAFIGFQVSLILHSGIKLGGTVAHIDPNAQQMTLKDVTLYFPGQASHRTPIYGVIGKDIADLQIVQSSSKNNTQDSSQHWQPPILPVSSLSQPVNSSSQSLRLHEDSKCTNNLDQSVANKTPSMTSNTTTTTIVYSCDEVLQPSRSLPQKQHNQPRPQENGKVNGHVKPTKSMSCTTDRKSKQQSRQHRRQNVNANGWADEDVNEFKEEEFDFQANLDMFDKAKVFAEIREFDETAAETLLVALNKLPPKALAKLTPKKVNLLPSENVLDKVSTPIDSDDNDDGGGGGCGDESDNDSETTEQNRGQQHHGRNNSSTMKKSVKIVTAVDGTPCPLVSPLQMAHAEHECLSVIGLNEDQMVENGGRGTYEVALKILANGKYEDNNDRLLILVLAGNSKNGAYGLSTARRLLNHGYNVVVCMVTGENSICAVTERQKVMLERIGGKILYDVQGLSQTRRPDLIIDAMLGSQTKLVDLQDERMAYLSICDMIQWTNNNSRTPVLSIDYPSGVDASTGQHHHPIHYIQPHWTVCLGAPKTGCISTKVTGELYMVDLGYPRLCWKKVGLKSLAIPWGANFVVGLKYL
ncbi:YjeF N-terminal domain-containing protein [Halteromyces radiatus]|uniref:YjeF N-terminal domain-containing protein n=1 Tax=Halteromyces radiatus TaxID=101107 RepID=UPI002220F547|nr:YjeF N-terminal domain-containing protein [Halteromyces radiatus]KAI8097646.1 YjeF N-terminal domain-containing protein [Halteromyces radiatus]